MGRRGPAPAPTAIQLAKGERRPSRVNYDEPQMAKPDSLEPPEGLTGAGLVEWQGKVADLVERGVLTDADMTAFRDYCVRLTRLEELRGEAARLGAALAVGKVTDAILKTEASVDRLRDRLGLTPSSRRSVKAAKSQPAPQANPSARYLSALTGGKSA